MSETPRLEWLFKYGQSIVWRTSSGLPYTLEQLARRWERAQYDETLEMPDEEDILGGQDNE